MLRNFPVTLAMIVTSLGLACSVMEMDPDPPKLLPENREKQPFIIADPFTAPRGSVNTCCNGVRSAD
jgi:hypothetical protein